MSSQTAIPAAQLAYRADDKPVIVARNILEEGASGYPRENFSGVMADSDESATSYPTRNLHDRRRGTQWRHDSASTRVFILLDAGAGNVLSADCLIVEGNDGSWYDNRLRVRCGDALTGGGALDFDYQCLSVICPNVNRYVSLWDYRYSARYWEIYLYNSLGTETWRAKQVFLGTQVLLPHHGNVPYDEEGRESSFVDTRARHGGRTRVSQWYDIRRREFDCWVDDSDSIDDLRDAYDDADGWAKPVWHIEYPTTDPDDSALFGFMEEPGLALPSQLETDRTWANAIVEQGPHLD